MSEKEINEFEFKNLIPSFIPSTKHLFQHHLRSFNYLLSKKMPQIIHAKVNNTIISEVKPDFSIRYKAIRIKKPHICQNFITRRLFPNECRLREVTYSGSIEVDVEMVLDNEENGFCHPIKNLLIGEIPIMIGSDYCWLSEIDRDKRSEIQECELDPSGYFVIKGIEKVILMQEQLCRNKILVDADSKTGFLQVSCASATLETKSKISIIIKNNRLYLKSSSFTDLIPLFIIFKAVGLESDKEIVETIYPFLSDQERTKYSNIFENIAYLSFEYLIKHSIITQEDALEFLSNKIKYLFKVHEKKSLKKKIEEVQNILSKIILPHIKATARDYSHKINFFGLMTRRLLRQYIGINKIEEGQTDIRNDRDYLANKRIECAGDLLGLLFEDLFKRYNGEIKKELDKKFLRMKKKSTIFGEISNIIERMFRSDTITNGLVHAISSGNWSIKRFRVDRKGVTQLMNRINYLGAVGMLTRLESHIEKSRKVSGPRNLQCSHWGFVCPVDTPDGENCGLVKNIALLAKITTEIDDYSLLKQLDDLGLIELGIFKMKEMRYNEDLWAIVLNGRIIGGITDCETFSNEFKKMRRIGKINKYVSIFEDRQDRIIDIWTDAGRMVRPLVNYNELKKNSQKFFDTLKKFSYPTKDIKQNENLINELLNLGIIDYLDVNELNNCNISFSPLESNEKTTHFEFSYDIILGALAGMIPYPQHNQSPRNTYQCAMGKQALGISGYNHKNRVDTVQYNMIYPQKPLVKTNTLELLQFAQLPAGMNATIAIMSFSGYDIEDAVVINKGSIQRGFGRAIVSKSVSVNFEGGLHQGDFLVETREDKDGIVKIGTELKKGDILVNRHTYVAMDDATNGREANPRAEKYKKKEKGRVQNVYLTSTGEYYLYTKLKISHLRIPEVGDKFSSRHGQKGVIGLRVSQSDLPFSETGWSPDLIMNPHGFPSRMTVGKLLELISSKASALEARIFSGTAFEDKELCIKCKKKCQCKDVTKNMGEILLKYGYNYKGTEILLSGSSGEYIKGYVFCGPVYYQRLKHMVADKIHARARVRKKLLTRQPLEGRAKEGGLRLGEMERDCLLAYGASDILIERFLLSSDEYMCPVCEACGSIVCDGSCQKKRAKVKKVRMPYPTKLLMQELISMNIMPKIKLVKDN